MESMAQSENSLLHTQEVAGSSPPAPTIPALANQQLTISIPSIFLLSLSKKVSEPHQKPQWVPKQCIKRSAFLLVSMAVQFRQRLPLHLQFHRRTSSQSLLQ
jgi:hypothetical protein